MHSKVKCRQINGTFLARHDRYLLCSPRSTRTPIVDGYINLPLDNLRGVTTLFIQYKHSGLESFASPVSVSTMNNETSKLRNRLMKHGWPNDRPFLFLWVTNREVTNDERAAPDKDLLWVDKGTLCEHAPLLGYRGLVPEESFRDTLDT